MGELGGIRRPASTHDEGDARSPHRVGHTHDGDVGHERMQQSADSTSAGATFSPPEM